MGHFRKSSLTLFYFLLQFWGPFQFLAIGVPTWPSGHRHLGFWPTLYLHLLHPYREWYSYFFFITQWIYYIFSCAMILTTQFYRISIPQPKHIPQIPKLSPLETISFLKSVSHYLFCKEVHSVLFTDSTCQWKHLMLVSHCVPDFT